MLVLRSIFWILMMETVQFEGVSGTMSPSIDNDHTPDLLSYTDAMDRSTLLQDHPDLRHFGYNIMDHSDNRLKSLPESSSKLPIDSTVTDTALFALEATTIETMSHETFNHNTSNTTNSILLDPSISDQSAKTTLLHATETLPSILQSNPPLKSSTFASPVHISNSFESGFVAHSHTGLNANSTAESLSMKVSASKQHSYHVSRFSHHSISTLSLDLLSFVSALLSTQPLLTIAQTVTSHPDVSMTTPETTIPPTAASQFDNVTFAPNTTSSAADIPAEESHNTSNVRLSTMLPRLLSAATQVDSSLPSGGGLGNDTVTGATPGEKSTHLTEGSIAGIVLGCLAAVFAFSLLMLCFCYKQKKMGTLSPKKKKKKKTSHYTGLFDDGISLSYINCQFEPTKDPIDEMASLDNDAYLNSLEQYMVNQTWLTKAPNTPNTDL